MSNPTHAVTDKRRMDEVICAIKDARMICFLVAGTCFVLSVSYLLLPVGSDRPSYMGVPHVYDDEVDLRIIVLAYNRPDSLRKCLGRIEQLDTLGDRVSVEIWIDRSTDGLFDTRCWDVAEEFRIGAHPGIGSVRVHVERNHSYIIGQWVNTWRPRRDSREVALFLEDDVDLSRFAYRWLKAAHAHFRSWPDVAGYTLQMENVRFMRSNYVKPAAGPKTDRVFLYQVVGTWGYSPRADQWRTFQDWFHQVWNEPGFHPYLPGTELNKWYRSYERKGRSYSMWEMYVIYFNHINNLYTVYPNLIAYTGRNDVLLDTHRQEPGLHSSSRSGSHDRSSLLMQTWDPDYVMFTDSVEKYVFDDLNYARSG